MIWEIDDSTRPVEGLDGRGRPMPEYAATLGLRRAPFGRRVLSTSIELGILLVLQLPVLVITLPLLVSAAGSVDLAAALARSGTLVLAVVCAIVSAALTTAFVVLQLVLHGRKGVTVGKAATGIRSVSVRTLERPGFWRGAVVRCLVLYGSFLIPLVGPVLVIALSPLFDPERRGRGWPDLAAATWFVDARGALNPYDVKRMRIARKTAATDLADERSELRSLATSAVPLGAAAYVPVTRSSGGVVGAPRGDAYPPGPAGTDASEPRAAAAPAAPPFVAGPASVGVAPASPASAGPGIPWTPPQLMPDPARGPAGAEPPSVPAPATRSGSGAVTLELDSGVRIDVAGSGILIGRDPAGAPADAGLKLIPVDDPTRSLSKTHLALVRTAGGGVAAIDRASTNGSALIRDGVEHSLPPGEAVAIRSGDTLLLGERRAHVRIG